MLNNKEIKEVTQKILNKRGFVIERVEESLVSFGGYGAIGHVFFNANPQKPVFKFYFNKEYTLSLNNDWESEKICFTMANRFSKIKEGLFNIYYEPPGIYECVTIVPTNVFEREVYEELLDYLICIAIEGYAVLNCEKFYKAAPTRLMMEQEFIKNISSLSSWNSPGRIAALCS